MGQRKPGARTRAAGGDRGASVEQRPSLGAEWETFAAKLAAFLEAPGERMLVLSAKDSPFYVQVATGDESSGRAEAVGDHYLPEESRLTPAQMSALQRLGWLAPTGAPGDAKEARGPDWSPNHFRRFTPPVDWREVARVLVETLASVFGVSDPGRLEYQAMDADSRRVLAPELGLEEHVSTPTAGKDASPRQRLEDYREFLTREGFRPWTEEELPHSVYFRSEGRTFSLRVSDGDPDFVHLSLGFALKDGNDELTLLRAAMRCQGDIKVAKVYVSPECDFVEFQTELFLGGHALSLDLLERCLATTRGLAGNFFDAISPDMPEAKA